ncbi:hypothetical protein CEXT_623461 [Caerostris extrusa]|uniref:Uncharacterized protein n=1 Tax=Caerostris extrusa TaxID=172846 RepID=A0AAV4M589_CAEEX|nr:hypothetical protein CEXT_623461 [Caerostris extrusa]
MQTTQKSATGITIGRWSMQVGAFPPLTHTIKSENFCREVFGALIAFSLLRSDCSVIIPTQKKTGSLRGLVLLRERRKLQVLGHKNLSSPTHIHFLGMPPLIKYPLSSLCPHLQCTQFRNRTSQSDDEACRLARFPVDP